MTGKVALIIVYNHKYDKNIPVLERVYGSRFSHIYHLVPFYTGDKENVIPVYENSFFFQGYLAQGFKTYFDQQFDHYFFIADDMIINPIITEHNYKEIFQLDESSGFIQELDSMPAKSWAHNRSAINFDPFRQGVEVKSELPAKEIAQDLMNRHNVQNDNFKTKEIYFYNSNYSFRNIVTQSVKYFYDKLVNKSNASMKYPVARSYSDILIVSGKNIKKFCHYCGVFAATDLWVELAIPTALILSDEKIVVQKQLKLNGRALWEEKEIRNELGKYELSLRNLLENFPAGYIYLHPVKLSKWKQDV